MRLFALAAAALALSGCAAQQAPVSAQRVNFVPQSLSRADIEEITKKVASRMKDPDSTRFSDITAVKSEQGVEVCGLVNAKNSFGGYVGYRAFYGALTLPHRVFFPIGVGEDISSDGASRLMCGDRGIILP